MSVLKRILVGRKIASEEAKHQLLPKRLALPVFASDPLSSNAYATEEILLVLAVAGASTFWLVTPLSIVIASVVVIVIISYRQTIRAYPKGGGSYRVASENLGTNYGLVAAAALLTDYTLTVAVSIAAGVAAITSAAPGLAEQRVLLSIGFVTLVMLANLRGVKESGTIFAIPTYLFVLSVWLLLAFGIADCIGGCPRAESASLPVEALSPLTALLVLRAFASGSTALTGIEAIADGVQAFRRPQAENAARTLTIMGFFTLSMFLGLSALARGTGVHPLDAEIAAHLGVQEKTVIAQIAETIFGGGFLFYLIQATTAGILILAANTAYADFPRLSSILAQDRFMPRQFMNRGDRLVFSNGVIVLSLLAIGLLIAFDASVTRLIQLYVVGVFTTFTLSQAGMVRRWQRLKEPKAWKRRAVLNAIGATTTGIVLVVVALTKFIHGAWIVIASIPVILFALRSVNRHYVSIGAQLRRPQDRPREVRTTRTIVLVGQVDEAAMRAIGYARAMRPAEVRALHIGRDGSGIVQKAWDERRVGIPLEIIDRGRGSVIEAIRSYIRALPRGEGEVVTIVIPEVVSRSRLRHYFRRRRLLLLKATLLFEPGVVVTDVTTQEEESLAPAFGAVAPARIVAIVPVSGVHNATLRALEYARSLSPSDLYAVTFNIEPEETEFVMNQWADAGIDMALEAVDSPFREVTEPLIDYTRELRRLRPDTVISVIMPEFIVRRWWHQALHNQTSLAIKAALLFEPSVVVTSVPFHLT